MNSEIYLLDASGLNALSLEDSQGIRTLWDTMHLLSALQGLANRDRPRLYVVYNREVDEFWLAQMRSTDEWLEQAAVHKVDSLDALLLQFRDCWNGFVVYDERVPATSNLASTVAGCDGLLPLRYDTDVDSLYQRLVRTDGKVVCRLLADDGSPLFTGRGTIPGTDLPSTGSAKNDAYRWLIEKYIRTGKANAERLGYYIDAFWLRCGQVGEPQNHTLTNHDYIIAHRGVFFDLNVWEDEAPVDEPEASPGLDLETLRILLDACNEQLRRQRIIHVSGYIPWMYKYADVQTKGWDAGSKHWAVGSEWKCTEILTSYNASLDADALSCASMVNASLFRHYDLPDRIPQNPRPDVDELRRQGILDESGRVVPRNYYAHYVGDYDAAAWLYWYLPRFWTDPARGELPLSWAFNPNLADRFPYGLHWARRTRSAYDYFVTGDSGAGYVNPRNFSEPRPYSGYTGAMGLWEEHCLRYMRQWDISAVGFVIDGHTENMTHEGWDAYARFAPGGIVMQHHTQAAGVYKGMSFLRTAGDLPRREASCAAARIHAALRNDGPNFLCFRSIVMTPSWYVDVETELDKLGRGDALLVDLETLLMLVRFHYSPA